MDRLLTMPVLVSMSGKICDMPHSVKRASAENEARCQIELYKRFGNDLTIIEYGLHGIGTCVGSKTNDPYNSGPALVEFAHEDVDDLEKLDFSKTLPENDPKCQKHLEAARITLEEVGEEVPCAVLIAGPFSSAFSVINPDKLLRALRKKPEGVHRLVRKCTDALKPIYKAFIETGCLILFCEPLSSGSVISHKNYIEFVKPYVSELMAWIHDCAGMVCYHICGETSKIFEEMAESGCDMMSVDNRANLRDVVERCGDKLPILGNVSPVDYLILGTEQEVDQGVLQCIQDAYQSPCGYILASGCDLSGHVPLENIEQFMASARKYGKYPVGTQNWS
jgi:uroporphyrinogen decarboxylase